MKQVDNR